MAKSLARYAIVSAISALILIDGAAAQMGVPVGGTTVIMERDWVAIGIAGFAVALTLFGFWRDRRKTMDAKKPAFDLHLFAGKTRTDYEFALAVRNRDDVSIKLKFLSVSAPLALECQNLSQHFGLAKMPLNDVVRPYDSSLIKGSLHAPSERPNHVTFFIEYEVQDKKIRNETEKLERPIANLS